MLSQIQYFSQAVDGRYATDEELQFLSDYLQSFDLRLSAYTRLQGAEATIIQQVQTKLRSLDPTLLQNGSEDLTAKWRRDTIRVLRYSAVAMLLNDADWLRDRLLYWMQTVMKAFGAQRSCDATYQLMQEVVRQHLTPPEAQLFCPILELNRALLGGTSEP
ncbi:MAG TPA: hypothetical protein V6C63_16835 [Allocoleopsis sp.]